MSKQLKIFIGLISLLFLGINFYLLYSEKSVISKSFYVKNYERMTENDFKELLPKRSLVAPLETHTVYVGDENKVESWLVQEGDDVFLGQELAFLNTDQYDNETDLWESELSGLMDQQMTLENLRSELETLRHNANTSNSTNTDTDRHVTEVDGKTMIELGMNIGLTVDVTQEGSYTQAISAIDQQLSDIERQMTVLDVKLAQDETRPALVSPIKGYVSKVNRQGSALSIDLYDEEQIVVTYVDEKDWQKIEEGQGVTINSEALEGEVTGDVAFVSSVPTTETELFNAYEQLDKDNKETEIAYYEIRISLDDVLENIPYTATVTADITINEAFDAVALPSKWGLENKAGNLYVPKLQENGTTRVVEVDKAFNVNGKQIIIEGLEGEDVVMQASSLYGLAYEPRTYAPFPMTFPTKEEWKAYSLKSYLKAMLWK